MAGGGEEHDTHEGHGKDTAAGRERQGGTDGNGREERDSGFGWHKENRGDMAASRAGTRQIGGKEEARRGSRVVDQDRPMGGSELEDYISRMWPDEGNMAGESETRMQKTSTKQQQNTRPADIFGLRDHDNQGGLSDDAVFSPPWDPEGADLAPLQRGEHGAETRKGTARGACPDAVNPFASEGRGLSRRRSHSGLLNSAGQSSGVGLVTSSKSSMSLAEQLRKENKRLMNDGERREKVTPSSFDAFAWAPGLRVNPSRATFRSPSPPCRGLPAPDSGGLGLKSPPGVGSEAEEEEPGDDLWGGDAGVDRGGDLGITLELSMRHGMKKRRSTASASASLGNTRAGERKAADLGLSPFPVHKYKGAGDKGGAMDGGGGPARGGIAEDMRWSPFLNLKHRGMRDGHARDKAGAMMGDTTCMEEGSPGEGEEESLRLHDDGPFSLNSKADTLGRALDSHSLPFLAGNREPLVAVRRRESLLAGQPSPLAGEDSGPLYHEEKNLGDGAILLSPLFAGDCDSLPPPDLSPMMLPGKGWDGVDVGDDDAAAAGFRSLRGTGGDWFEEGEGKGEYRVKERGSLLEDQSTLSGEAVRKGRGSSKLVDALGDRDTLTAGMDGDQDVSGTLPGRLRLASQRPGLLSPLFPPASRLDAQRRTDAVNDTLSHSLVSPGSALPAAASAAAPRAACRLSGRLVTSRSQHAAAPGALLYSAQQQAGRLSADVAEEGDLLGSQEEEFLRLKSPPLCSPDAEREDGGEPLVEAGAPANQTRGRGSVAELFGTHRGAAETSCIADESEADLAEVDLREVLGREKVRNRTMVGYPEGNGTGGHAGRPVGGSHTRARVGAEPAGSRKGGGHSVGERHVLNDDDEAAAGEGEGGLRGEDGLEKLLCGRAQGDGHRQGGKQRGESPPGVLSDLQLSGKQQQQALSFMSFAHGGREAEGRAIVRVERVTRSTTCTSVASGLGGRSVKKMVVQRQMSVLIHRRAPVEVSGAH